jgi:hypothetical protein
MRNMFARYSGGAYSRAGTAFTGFSKQTGRTFPPRLIPFQFNISQGLALEFGNFYMRVVSDGGYVTEGALPVLGLSNANPAVLTTASSGAQSATSNVAGVTATYAPGDRVTLAGGTFGTPAVLGVTNTQLVSTTVLNPGTLYVPADTIHVSGGVQSVSAIVTVATTRVVSATVAAAGAGGTDGQQTVTGTTGTGTLFSALVTVAAGAITAVISISLHGSYTVNPAALANEPVTGAGVVGGQLALVMGVNTVTASTPGTFTTNPANGVFTQASTSGSGTGATFNASVLGPRAVSVVSAGSYSAFPGNPVPQASTTGVGLGATFTVVSFATQPYNIGDWVVVDLVGGMTQVNGRTFVVSAATPTTITLSDVFGVAINSTAFGTYTGGGTVSRIYTAVSPYAEADLPWLKWTQSADVMSICCLNQSSGVSYQPQDLARQGATDWVFTAVSPQATISAPTGVSASASAAGSACYGFIVTAVAADGSESLGSAPVFAQLAVNIYATAGTITTSWGAVNGAVSYNVYQAGISFSGPQPGGTPYGIVATGLTGTSWQNSNILPDFATVPPQHYNPFPGPAEFPSVVNYFQQRRMYANSTAARQLFPVAAGLVHQLQPPHAAGGRRCDHRRAVGDAGQRHPGHRRHAGRRGGADRTRGVATHRHRRLVVQSPADCPQHAAGPAAGVQRLPQPCPADPHRLRHPLRAGQGLDRPRPQLQFLFQHLHRRRHHAELLAPVQPVPDSGMVLGGGAVQADLGGADRRRAAVLHLPQGREDHRLDAPRHTGLIRLDLHGDGAAGRRGLCRDAAQDRQPTRPT